MALTKADFAERLFNELGIDKRKAKDMVDLFFEEVKSSLEQGNPVKISGFGKFELRDKTSRPGRNPKTGEEIPITAKELFAKAWLGQVPMQALKNGKVVWHDTVTPLHNRICTDGHKSSRNYSS